VGGGSLPARPRTNRVTVQRATFAHRGIGELTASSTCLAVLDEGVVTGSLRFPCSSAVYGLHSTSMVLASGLACRSANV